MHGSLTNRLLENSVGETPVIGMGATITHWSDRTPATVVEVKVFKSGARKGMPREIVVQYDHWKVVSGSTDDGSAKYEYERDANGHTEIYVVNNSGRWVKKGLAGKGNGLVVGERDRYWDPHS
ncbi:hypothetical protein [Streptomyces cucumeris]|uniref:hypothetical protein n=1 Tax=Streptomyces cucumeris TaxID=2962890 RepID=UPI0020C8EDF1|nr:hypothetical protein [Streptomyces sp. NEAU-Y11]MCP9209600.1 hypothetical protein [Streptomyces sp. NEAU-Y11]